MESSINSTSLRGLRKQLSPRSFCIRCSEGYAIAEFAIVLPTLLLFAFGLLTVLGLGAEQISLNARCVEVARIIARGDVLPEEIAQDTRYEFDVSHDNGLVAVEIKRHKHYSILGFTNDVTLKAKASALDETQLS